MQANILNDHSALDPVRLRCILATPIFCSGSATRKRRLLKVRQPCVWRRSRRKRTMAMVRSWKNMANPRKRLRTIDRPYSWIQITSMRTSIWGNLLLENGEAAEAKDHFEKASALNPKLAQPAQLSREDFHARGKAFSSDCTIRRSVTPSSGFSRGGGKPARRERDWRSVSVMRITRIPANSITLKLTVGAIRASS